MPQLIETLRTEADGSIPLLARHLRRLQNSAATLGYVCPCADIERALMRCVRSLPPEVHRLRLLLWRSGLYTLESAPLPPLGGQQNVALANLPLDDSDPWLRHKTTRRPRYTAASEWLASQPSVFDVLFFNSRGELAEGSRSNLYLRLPDNGWYTPPAVSGLLPGVQRGALLDAGLVQERVLNHQDLARATALRLSNALRGWFDVKLTGLTFPG